MSEQTTVRGLGDNKPPLTRDEILDPGLIQDQLEQDYGAHIRKRDELLGGAARLCLRYSSQPRGPDTPDAPRRGDHFILQDGSNDPGELVIWNGGPDWVKATPADTVRRLLDSVVIPDEGVQAKATTFVRQIKDLSKKVEGDRVKEKTSFDDASKAVQAFFKAGIIDGLDAVASSIERGPMTAYTRRKAEEERLRLKKIADDAAAAANKAALEAAKTQKEAAIDTAIEASETADRTAKAAAAPVADLGRTRGFGGGVASARTDWSYEVIDEALLPREYWLIDHTKLAQTAKRDKEQASVPGVKFTSTIRTQV